MKIPPSSEQPHGLGDSGQGTQRRAWPLTGHMFHQ